MVATIYRHRRRVDGEIITARTYRGRYRLDGESKIVEVPLKTSDKQAARIRLEQIIQEKERERAGILPPKAMRDAAVRPLTDHLGDFLSDLTALRRSGKYLYHLRSRVTRVLEECRWSVPADITRDSFVAWRARWTKSPKTVNEYLNALNALLNWMLRQERIPRNPLQGVTHADTRGLRGLKRAFSDDEFTRFIAVAGAQRSLYLTAAYTGLRLGELRALLWSDVHLDHARPHFVVRAATTKNRSIAHVPLHPQIADELRRMRPSGARPADAVFAGCHHATAARRILVDLAAAGIARVDEQGRKLCFHSLRYTFATKLAQHGVAQRTAQELLRHSDPRLTANLYTDVTRLPTFDAVYALRWHAEPTTSRPSDALIANGAGRTYGGPQTSDTTGHLPANLDTLERDPHQVITPSIGGNNAGFEGQVVNEKWRREGDSNPR